MNKKKYCVIFLAVFSFLLFDQGSAVLAITYENWNWGGTQSSNSAYQGMGWVNTSNLIIPSGDGKVTGYAWAGNGDSMNLGYGWIDFSPQDNCGVTYNIGNPASCADPIGGTGGVTKVGSKLIGWARIISIANDFAVGNSGGWEGWIKMGNEIGDSYGVDFSKTKNNYGELNNSYAWSNELGFIDFSGINATASTNEAVSINFFTSLSENKILLTSGDSVSNENAKVNLAWTISGSPDHCIATCGNENSCGVSWTGNKSVTAGNEIATLTADSASFILSCYDSENNLLDSEELNIVVGCNDTACSSNLCLAVNFKQTDTYSCNASCNTNTDCINASLWRPPQKEVAP